MEIVLLTNNLKLAASTIGAIYKQRWQIELFFKATKQNLKIKTFVGTSANAVHVQIWTALIAILLLKYLQMRSSLGWSLSKPWELDHGPIATGTNIIFRKNADVRRAPIGLTWQRMVRGQFYQRQNWDS